VLGLAKKGGPQEVGNATLRIYSNLILDEKKDPNAGAADKKILPPDKELVF